MKVSGRRVLADVRELEPAVRTVQFWRRATGARSPLRQSARPGARPAPPGRSWFARRPRGWLPISNATSRVDGA
eukprot:8577137-Lingulodinium_polyedra.AAC.1